MTRGVQLKKLDGPWQDEATRSQEEANFYSSQGDHSTRISDLEARMTTAEADIAALETRMTAAETELARLEQDKLNITDALQIFSFASYLSVDAPINSAFADLGATWQKLTILNVEAIAPRGLTFESANARFSFDYDGIYRFSISGSMEHDSSNNGRVFYLRLYNETKAVGGPSIVIGTGRNAEATSLSANFLVEIDDTVKGDFWSFEIGNGDTYLTVNFQALGYDINSISEWREPVGSP